MRRIVIGIYPLFLLLCSEAFADKGVITTVPVFSQKVSFKTDKIWKGGHQASNQAMYLLELIPPSEKIESWNTLLALSAFRGAASQLTAKKAYEIEADSVVKACPGNYINAVVDLPDLQGYDTVYALIGCKQHPQFKDKNEIGFYAFIKGKSDVYMFKKSFREPLAGGAAPRLSEATYKTLAPEVLSLQICKNDGQGPECLPEAATR